MNKKCTVPMYGTGQVVRNKNSKEYDDCSEEILVPTFLLKLTNRKFWHFRSEGTSSKLYFVRVIMSIISLRPCALRMRRFQPRVEMTIRTLPLCKDLEAWRATTLLFKIKY
jgi:hypothetical protein